MKVDDTHTDSEISATAIAVTVKAAVTPLAKTMTAWEDGNTYDLSSGNVTFSDAVTVSGNVTLTLTAIPEARPRKSLFEAPPRKALRSKELVNEFLETPSGNKRA